MASKKREEQGIAVYLRIRPAPTPQQSRLLTTAAQPLTLDYDVEDTFGESVLHLRTAQRLVQEAQRSTAGPSPPIATAGGAAAAAAAAAVVDDVVNNTVVDFRYRFRRIFKQTATQEDVFGTVAQGCIESVLDGVNSTIFAYGQTGSGKTYSVTGGTESYHDRGLIPRAMAMIYEEVDRRHHHHQPHGRSDDGAAAMSYTITMSYLQIYNDKGQDLLNHGRDARTLEELPAVTVHEMEDDILLRGLEQHSAPTLSDALNLLFLGDTNRLYCETPMNKTSSRSHCIFTIYLEARSAASAVVRRSKLNLVDLAGSERVSKTGVSGSILTEAKHINLSLHFLEQVIVALSEKARGVREHVPYRNSLLTMVLRDSLGRNCRTVMLATAHIVASQAAETLSTCQFAQRVALIQQAPQVNVETDPVLLVRKLRAEVAQLKDEVAYLRVNGNGGGGATAAAADRVLTPDEMAVCRGMVDAYVQRAAVDGDWDSRLTGFNGDVARMSFCYDILRERLVRGGSGGASGATSTANSDAQQQQQQQQQQQRLADCEVQVATLQQSLQLKENELQMLLSVLKNAGHAGVTGVAGGAGVGARFNAEAQTPSSGEARSLFLPPPPPPQQQQQQRQQNSGSGSDAAAVEAEEASMRRAVYHDAQRLAAQLRRSAGGVAAAAPVQTAAAALSRVAALAQDGRLTEAEATAATAFLESKRDYQQRVDGVPGSCDADSRCASADARTAVDVLVDQRLELDRAAALDTFKASYAAQQKVEETKQLLPPRYAACKATALQLNACVDAMKQLKSKINRRRAERAADGVDAVDPEETAWLAELSASKEDYNECAARLRAGKAEIEGMHAYLTHAQAQLARDFERWFTARQQQVQLAVQQQQRHEKQAGLSRGLHTALDAATSASGTAATAETGGCATPPPPPSLPLRTTTTAVSGSLDLQRPPTSVATQVTQQQERAYAMTAPSSTAAAALSSVARGQHRLASLPTTTTTTAPTSATSARLAPQFSDAPAPQPHSADAASTRLSPPPSSHLHQLSWPAPVGGPLGLAVGARDGGWTASSSPLPHVSLTTTAGGAAGPTTPSPTRPFHLHPISSAAPSDGGKHNNPYLPHLPSTGNAAADEQLAELYKARDAMRRQLM
ncbi:kinesin [Novymonas esmeraldas]|uniref:Kinesin n=1 Tax=Novymonas esmeraldas TaxID=1808958 RepID=A0AAW0ETL7_9TRYP